MEPMPDLQDDTIIFPTLQRLQECLCQGLAAAGGPGLCYCGLMVGDIMPLQLVQCGPGGCGGVAWVRPSQIFPSLILPEPEPGESCLAPLAVEVEIGVARCYPMPDPRKMIDPQAMFEASRLYMSDMRAMRKAIRCCLDDNSFQGSYSMGTWAPIEASGGISGGTWTVTIRPEV